MTPLISTPSLENLSALAQLNPAEFEVERVRIINEYISTLPVDRQKTARKIQNDLDLKRLSLSSNDFMVYCTSRIKTNLETIADLASQASIMASEMKNIIANQDG